MHENNMKKVFGVFVLVLLVFSMCASFVSAANGEAFKPVQEVVNGVYKTVEPLLRAVIGDQADTPEMFLAKILLLIIILSVVWMAVNKIPFFPDNGWVVGGISVAVSLLSVRWFGNVNVIQSVILPYSALGIALTAGFPFILWFLIVKDLNRTARKISWIFFIMVFLGLWIMRAGESGVGNFAWIYLATAAAGLAVLGFDGTITKVLNKIKIEKGMSYKDLERKHRLLDELESLQDLKAKMISRDVDQHKISGLESRIDKLEEKIAEFD